MVTLRRARLACRGWWARCGPAAVSGIPGVLIHGRLDLGGPADTAWQLAQAWPGAELYFVGTGHQGGAEMTDRMIEATNRFASSV
jgi:proline iminopeptidase